jgi:hypothetical protein
MLLNLSHFYSRNFGIRKESENNNAELFEVGTKLIRRFFWISFQSQNQEFLNTISRLQYLAHLPLIITTK